MRAPLAPDSYEVFAMPKEYPPDGPRTGRSRRPAPSPGGAGGPIASSSPRAWGDPRSPRGGPAGRGRIARDLVVMQGHDRLVLERSRANKLLAFRGLARVPVERAEAGERDRISVVRERESEFEVGAHSRDPIGAVTW